MAQDPFKIIKDKETKKEVRILWDHFAQISKIPRKSGNETQIAKHITSWARKNKFFTEVDTSGNLLVLVPPSPKLTTAPGVILQGHLDMVCVGSPDPALNGITPFLSSDLQWLQATNTTLGADNGIGLATLFSLAQNHPNHGPLALMLTTREETGIGGALNMNFQTSLDNYRYLLNLDSEELGIATISSAGGGDSIISLPLKREGSGQKVELSLTIEGLIGGHSGVEIHKNHLNAIKIVADIFRALTIKIKSLRLIDLNLGYARNVIPSSGQISLCLDQSDLSLLKTIINQTIKKVLSTSKHPEEQKLKVSLTPTSKESSMAMTTETTLKVIKLLQDLPHGVISWNPDIKDLVQTSTNLAKITTTNQELVIETMTRSSLNSELSSTRAKVESAATPHGAKVIHKPAYPGWPANPNSQIIKLTKNAWKNISNQDLKILAIHAGLECGAIINKYPHLEAISIGPDIQGAHSTKEKVHLGSVTTFYVFVEELINKINQN